MDMKKGIVLGLGMLVGSGLSAALPAYAEKAVVKPEAVAYHHEVSSPLLKPYHYKVAPDSWYLAKVKPKWQMQAKVRTEAAHEPPTPAQTVVGVAHALPFWNDIPPR
jgi:hypothetical protein